jgi:hypothetical protein
MSKIVQARTKSNSSHEINVQSAQIVRTNRAKNVRISPFLLDTLAQLGTDHPEKNRQKSPNPYYKRAVAKYITNEILFPLIDLNSPLKDSYWRTWHCVSVLLQDGKKITGKYCNNRWCIVCDRIRTAKLINGYLEVIQSQVPDPYFVTLTIPNMPASELKQVIDGMIKTINRINNLFRHRRNFRITGIRKLECTYSIILVNYHPHFHFIINTRRAGLALISEWLNQYPLAVMEAQDIRRADKGSIIEMFKYCTKIVSKNGISREEGKAVVKVHAAALDTIFQAMFNRRVFQPMGLNKVQINEDVSELESQVLDQLRDEVNIWSWEQELSDWVNEDGEGLTDSRAYERYKIQNC